MHHPAPKFENTAKSDPCGRQAGSLHRMLASETTGHQCTSAILRLFPNLTLDEVTMLALVSRLCCLVLRYCNPGQASPAQAGEGMGMGLIPIPSPHLHSISRPIANSTAHAVFQPRKFKDSLLEPRIKGPVASSHDT